MQVQLVVLKRKAVRATQGLESHHSSLLCYLQLLSPSHTAAIEAGGVSQWYNSCLICVKPEVWGPFSL